MTTSDESTDFGKIVNFLFEVEMLSSVPRSGYHVLGGVKQSVAEHSFNIAMIAYAISQINSNIDVFKLLKMCLLHDLPEARTGDQHYINKKYVQADENQVIVDQSTNLPNGEDYIQLMHEFNEDKTLEAHFAHDADQLELLLVLKRATDIGHHDAKKWAYYAKKRIKTEIGKKLAETIEKTRSDAWWFTDDEDWWVNANNNKK